MWRKRFEMYARRPIPPEEEIRVLVNRPHFEAKLAAGTRDLPMKRFVDRSWRAVRH